jgi:hypothetical protein
MPELLAAQEVEILGLWFKTSLEKKLKKPHLNK